MLEPAALARGRVKVSAEGQPVADAEVLVFAVDDAVLTYGRWQLPDFFQTFFPREKWEVPSPSRGGRAIMRVQTSERLPMFTQGSVAPGFEKVAEAFAQNFEDGAELGAGFAAILDGEVVAELCKRAGPW